MSLFYSAGLGGAAIPDAQIADFEHNDLSNVFTGPGLTDYSISNTRSNTGSYSLLVDDNVGFANPIAKDADKFGRVVEDGNAWEGHNYYTDEQNQAVEFLFFVQDINNPLDGCYGYFDVPSGAEIRINRYDNGTQTTLSSSSLSRKQDEWTRMSASVDTTVASGNNTHQFEMFDSASDSIGSVSAEDRIYTEGAIGFRLRNSDTTTGPYSDSWQTV